MINCDRFWIGYTWFCNAFGILTAFGLWGVGVESVYRREVLGVYVLCIAVIVTFVEMIAIVDFWLAICTTDANSRCRARWKTLTWLDNWKRALLYVVLSVGCFVRLPRVWLSAISGVMLLISSVLYSCKTFKDRRRDLLPNSRIYNRFADNAGDVAAGDDVITGHVTRGGTPIVRDTATARLTSNAGDYYDDAWDV